MELSRIVRLGHLGDGIAEDGTLHPLTLPGDGIRADDGSRVPSADPIHENPVCPHFGTCGGCALQHATDAFISQWKQDVVRRALVARGVKAPLRNMHVSPAKSRRRVVFSGRRTKKTERVGFHRRGSDEIVALETCHVILPGMLDLLPVVRSLVRLGVSRSREVKVSLTASDGGWDIDVREAKSLDGPLREELARQARRADLARLSWNGEAVVVLRPPVQRFGTAQVVPPPGAFLQATTDAEAFLVSAVQRAVGDATRVADLFCGCGTFALPLAAGAEVLAVEAEQSYLDALDAGWRGADALRKVTTARRDLFRRPVLASEFKGIDAVVIDPPRAGAEAQMHEVAGSDIASVAAVSCHPVSFARDAAILVGAGFGLDWIDIVDQFRWSPHVELVARFSR